MTLKLINRTAPNERHATDHATLWQRPLRILMLALAGAGTMACAAAWGPSWLPVTILGTLLVIDIGRSVASGAGRVDLDRLPQMMRMPFLLARDTTLFERYQEMGKALLQVGGFADTIFRELAAEKLQQTVAELHDLGAGRIIYDDTETWRLAYEQLLRSPGILTYRSVACVTGERYWQDEPGRKSMRLNYELQENGIVAIERIVILPEALWPGDADLPIPAVRDWLIEQHDRGIMIRLVPQSELTNEPDLLVDFGIYGSRAVGEQQLGIDCRTVRFMLSFEYADLAAAESRWNRLAVYATSLADLMRAKQAGNWH